MHVQRVQVISFERDQGVSEALDIVLLTRAVRHIPYVLPITGSLESQALECIEQHQPKLILTSWAYGIGDAVIAAAASASPRPAIWVLSTYDADALLNLGALFKVQRVFSKAQQSLLGLADEVRQFLDDTELQPVRR